MQSLDVARVLFEETLRQRLNNLAKGPLKEMQAFVVGMIRKSGLSPPLTQVMSLSTQMVSPWTTPAPKWSFAPEAGIRRGIFRLPESDDREDGDCHGQSPPPAP